MGAKRSIVGLCCLLAACSDDGVAGADTDAGTTTHSGTPSAGSSSTGMDPTGSPTSLSEGGSDDGPGGETTGDDPSSSTGDATTGGPDPSMGCPDGPFAATPLSEPMMVAAALDNTSTSAGANGLLEGPVWWNGALHVSHFWFVDQPPPAVILRYDGTGFDVAFDDSGTNGLAVHPDGRLVGAEHLSGSISALDPASGTRTMLVDGFEGQRFNSPNDLTFRSDGTFYFTDPTYQAPNPQPQPVTGVYRVSVDGSVERFESGLGQPNGITLSPEEDVLYVAHLDGIERYTISDDGSVVTPGADFGGVSGVDGMAIDCAGNLYATVHNQGRIVVLSPDATVLGEITVAPQVTNAAFGGPDMQTLYITAGNPDAGNALYSVDLEIPGYPY